MKDRSVLIPFLSALSLMALCWVACEKKHETPATEIRVVMKNETGGHMTLFDLEYGHGRIQYDIFSRDYTFSQNIPAPSVESPMRLTFHNDAGIKVEYALERPLAADMAGGSLWLYFKPEGICRMRMDWP